jgi:signal transduction histidine kinase
MQVEDILDRKGHRVYAVRPDWLAREAAASIAAWNIGAALVTDGNGALLGIISERDFVRSFSEFGGGLSELRVDDLMTKSVITCAPEATVNDALSLMALHRIRHLPVIQDEKILGVLSVRDVLESRMEALEEHFAALIGAKRASSRAREVAELSNRATAELLTNLSHGLTAPLSTIIGYAEMLTDKAYVQSDASEIVQSAHKIEKSGRIVLETVNNLLDLSRIQIGVLEPAKESLDIVTLVSTCSRVFSEQAAQNGVTVNVEADDALPTLAADKEMTKRMLLNLLANAVRFTRAGGTVTIRCTLDENDGIRVSVIDTGIGIAPENLAKMVEPFQRVETSTTRRDEGVGLGLTLVNAMIQAHGGTLSLDSKMGIGTAVTLRFPPTQTVATPRQQLGKQPEAA